MNINTEALKHLARKYHWSIPELADQLGIDYSYLFRVLNNQKKGGSKLFSGIYILCKKEKLNVEDYIFLKGTLSTNNKIN